VQQLDPQYQLI
jgi:hypothetical protein